MKQIVEQHRTELIETLLDYARAKLTPEQLAQAESFVRRYYTETDPDDLAERSHADLYGAALAHLNFGRRFAGGEPKVRVYNPSFAEHSWQSTHTVVEIINDDMPFLVDSVTMEANRQGLTLHLMIHPVLRVRRDAQGNLVSIESEQAGGKGRLESFIHMAVDRRTEAGALARLHEGIVSALADVRHAVEDWPAMTAQMRAAIDATRKLPPPLDPDETGEDLAFLEWLAAQHFTFLGYRDYDLVTETGEDVLRIVRGSGLGILRSRDETISTSFAALPPEARARARRKELLVLTKANSRSTVHRPGYLDYVGVKRFDANGNVCGERRFIGLYTSTAYNADPADIPLLRRKLRTVLERAGFLPKSHSEKALVTILETYPRDELFQIDTDDLYNHAMGILRLGERQRTRLFVRRDIYGRFFSCLIYVPRENYTSELCEQMQRILLHAFDGVSPEFTVHLSESVLARILIIVRTRPGSDPHYEVRELEARLTQAARRWQDDLLQALVEHCGEERGNRLYARYGSAFPAGYREDYLPQSAVHDIEMMDALEAGGIGLNLYLPVEAEPGTLRFKIIRAGAQVPLSQSLPMLEHMGVKVQDERPYKIESETLAPVWIDDFGMSFSGEAEMAIEEVRANFQDAFQRMWSGEIESDDFNRLVLRARLTWREITVLRAYAKYLRQAGFTFSQAYIQNTLAGNPAIARLLVELFKRRFDPAGEAGRAEQAAALAADIGHALDAVANLDEDRILRQYLAVIQATLRTNYFQHSAGGGPKTYLSFKFDPARVPGLPEPRPIYEIWVYSPRVEGVHLRGGRVARGGLRWSDRMEDFRTEVLGLMKAQMVKNAVIVPVGSKGGFVLKRAPAAGDRDALMKEGIACYQTFLRGLLDITDNLAGSKVVPPAGVVRHDADDPYLVVAADKGTATFSDIANGVAREYGYWLDDAFASGGSVGYDHKKMSITARGVWESVKRHFRELGIDTQSTDFSVVGIGDMSGDVFGNGMLLSRHIRLLAAFDHRDFFIDPAPDVEASFKERERLFALPRSCWADYDAKLISKGGGVYPRSAKSIALSPEARTALDISADSLTPNELASAILKAPVDLLYNGGIGTYVKASRQSHADVGDRANDAIRVNGSALRCRVVAEGGNLGFTQLGRIEYASNGGRIYTDAIDNSAGVDCSDHEVNIKILLNAVVAEGELTDKQRNKLLAQMTDEVAALVLRDNYFQTQSLSVSGVRAAGLLDGQARFIRSLEKAGRLKRAIEFLPSDEEIAERKAARKGLTGPERAVLLAYSKIALYDELLASDVPEDAYISTALERYFPEPLQKVYAEQMRHHPLRREIVAAYVTNSMINRVGSTFVHRMQEETGARAAEIVRAYILTRAVFNLVRLWKAIEALDNRVADALQSEMLIEAGRLIVRASLWMLRNRRQAQPLALSIDQFAPGVAEVEAKLEKLLPPVEAAALAQETDKYAAAGVPQALARRIAGLDALYAALDIVEVASAGGRSIAAVAATYFALGGRLNFAWLRKQITALTADNHWQTLARAALRDDLASQQRALTAAVLQLSPKLDDADELIGAWEAKNRSAIERIRQVISDLQATGNLDLSMLSVALRELRNLA